MPVLSLTVKYCMWHFCVASYLQHYTFLPPALRFMPAQPAALRLCTLYVWTGQLLPSILLLAALLFQPSTYILPCLLAHTQPSLTQLQPAAGLQPVANLQPVQLLVGTFYTCVLACADITIAVALADTFTALYSSLGPLLGRTVLQLPAMPLQVVFLPIPLLPGSGGWIRNTQRAYSRFRLAYAYAFYSTGLIYASLAPSPASYSGYTPSFPWVNFLQMVGGGW